ncbi:hypothetical protein CI109_102657 [Kwoniella shandongensis]|uniref:Uncharacterized protein n=1 Tax=Kwoniella shandongensis TaxID=1734106 RepID=A0A5M6BUF8_9TREE|nr:uncharacterized protein CI109_005237 [Kwoniella shandongensis]KAA5526467.1 hypothetical protein CI109_005237 [Kwoniella shandongensis]
MFSSLGLFADAKCPDPTCGRMRCFFSHAQASSSKLPQQPVTKRTNVEIPSSIREPNKRKANQNGDEEEDEARKATVKKLSQMIKKDGARPASTVGTAGKPAIPTTAPSKPETKSAPVIRQRPNEHGQPPSLPFSIQASPHPRTDRQKALGTLYTQFSKLYAQILHLAPELAHQNALTQESEISSSSTTIRAYKTAIHHAAVSVSRRKPPDTIPHPSIGTLRESRLATEAAEKEKASRLTRSRIDKYCLPLPDFEKWRYPDPRDGSLTSPDRTGNEPDAEGTTQTCNRCKIPFVVSSKNLDGRFGECHYHYGKTAPERVEGRRKWIYSCCGRERGEQGCEEGIHVFSDGDEDKALAKRVGFKTVKQCVEEAKGLEVGEGVEVVGMDCEMIYTTAGSSLGRVTIVDENGGILLDELVRQRVPILDLNSRFSGIYPGQLEAAVMDINAVRAAACMFIGPQTILVGHGLENDLRALRLLHDRVIDTAIVFPHDKGPPYRRALRDIVKEKLGYFIQDRTSDLGHSSAVDATATLDALKWKVRDDNE